MMRTWSSLLISAFLAIASTAQAGINTIILGPNYEKNQKGTREVAFAIPDGWVRDEKTARDAGLYAIFLPKGRTLQESDAIITIAFQRKDSAVPGLETLENFYRVDMQNMFQQFPNMQASRWQPTELKPDSLHFMSIELYGTEPDKPSPHRLLMLDAGDGFYSIVLTVSQRQGLNNPAYEHFFNSIHLEE